jgi:predicted dehydrogenase
MSTDNQPINVAVIGTGRMGAHHTRTAAKVASANLLAVVDADSSRADAMAKQYGCEACKDVAELLSRFPQVQACVVSVPTIYHVPVALPLLSRGIACLVEKPLAATPQDAKKLADLATAHNTVLQVGHTERFNPGLRAVSALNLKPRFMDVQRVSPMTFRSLDIGVVMDMMIHDLDIVLHLAQSKLKSVHAVGTSIISEHEDICNARLTFESGCIVNITASRMALTTERRMRLFSDDAFVNLDYATKSGIVVRKSAHADKLDEIRQLVLSGQDLSSMKYTDLVHVEPLQFDLPEGHEDQLTAQLECFLDSVREGKPVVVDGEAGVAAVEAAKLIVQSIAEHKWQEDPTSVAY